MTDRLIYRSEFRGGMMTISCCLALLVLLCAGATCAAFSAEVIKLDFRPPPLDRFEKELDAIRQKNGIAKPKLDSVLALVFPRDYARPGDRWIEGNLLINPTALKNARLEVELFALGSREPVAKAAVAPSRHDGTLLIDLRSANLAQARVVATLAADGKRIGVVEAFVSAHAAESTLQEGQRIPIRFDVPKGTSDADAVPVTFGVPFAAGTLWDATRLRLINAAGRELPHQKEVTALWAKEGAIKWVRFDALVVPKEGCFVEIAAAKSLPGPIVRVAEQGGKIVVDTGAANYVLAKGASPVEEIRVGVGRVAMSAGTRGMYVTDQSGRVASASAEGETMLVEARGPVAACVRFEGFYRTAQGETLARHITRLEFFAGQTTARIQHTLVLSEDSNKVWFKDIGWELAAETGADASAFFATARDDSTRFTTCAPSSWLLQDRHFHFAHDTNHFVVADGKAGTECGDWFLLAGKAGGLGWSCRDAARQYPKEFEVQRGRVVLHLYSSRAGEALDFRMPALLKQWNFTNWYPHVLNERDKPRIGEFEQRALKIKHNAVGWAKTHNLLLAPLPSANAMAAASRAHSQPVLALADPSWTWKTGAAGAMHPKDAKNFPAAERLIEGGMHWWHARIHEFGEYGFVDYYAGPHLSYRGIFPEEKRYHWATYGLRPGLWRVCLRGGDRDVREFAERCTQSFMDNMLAHWDGAGKVRGLYVASAAGGDEPATPATLPLYWQGGSGFEISSSTDLDQFLHCYQLTGNRRAKDVVLQFADGAKRDWTPAKAARDWRGLMMMRTLVQAYGFTWDEELRAMAEATTDSFSDTQGEIGLTKNRPYNSSTYKTQVDVAALLDAWEILGQPRYRELARKAAEHWWAVCVGNTPLQYMNPQGRIGNFLFSETGDPSIPEVLAQQIRWASTHWDADKNNWRGSINASEMLFVVQGIAWSQDVLARSSAWTQPTASWAGANDFGYPVSFVVQKKADEALDLRVSLPAETDGYGIAGAGISVKPLAPKSAWGLDLNRVTETSSGSALVRLPKDAPAGAYELTPRRQGNHLVMANARAPLVLHAPEYWQPTPPSDPPVRYFFRVPDGVSDAQIFFEGTARLFDPQGNARDGGKPQHGWVDLKTPGLWSFEPLNNKLVRVRNAPPFFAARDAAFYFEPPIAWQREPTAATSARPDPKTLFVAGAVQTPNNQALHIAGRRVFALEAGPAHTSGDGGQFLPFKQGTIEFFYKPNWSTFDLETEQSPLLSMSVAPGGQGWGLTHYTRPDAADWFQSRTLLAQFTTTGASKMRGIRCYRRTIFEAGKWVHVAWVWGQPPGAVSSRGKKNILVTQIYINGQPGFFQPDQVPGNVPAFAPESLHARRGFDGAMDELRISDVMRYTATFTPPSTDRESSADEHTRALFHFNGALDGESAGHKGTLPVTVK